MGFRIQVPAMGVSQSHQNDHQLADIAATGKPAFYEPDVEQIIGRVKGLAREGDVVVVFSNGGFDNIHTRLLAAL